MPVKWDELLEAYEFVSASGLYGDHRAWVCRTSGMIYWDSGLSDDGFEEEDELDERSDAPKNVAQTASDDPDTLPDDIEDEDEYLAIPNKKELDLGSRLAFAFTRQFLPSDYDEVRHIFGRRGAYSRFKALLARKNALDQWHAFEEKATEEALRTWCEINSVEIEEPAPRPKGP